MKSQKVWLSIQELHKIKSVKMEPGLLTVASHLSEELLTADDC